jgi:hypothetical protein
MKRFSASEPRKMFWSRDVGGHTSCPECGGPLANEHHTYVMATRRRGQIDRFLVGNDGGHFCSACATVVLDSTEFAEAAAAALGPTRGAEFAILGLVNLEAVPKEKSRVPLGADGNPVPLVGFTNLSTPAQNPGPGAKKGRKHRRGLHVDERAP